MSAADANVAHRAAGRMACRSRLSPGGCRAVFTDGSSTRQSGSGFFFPFLAHLVFALKPELLLSTLLRIIRRGNGLSMLAAKVFGKCRAFTAVPAGAAD